MLKTFCRRKYALPVVFMFVFACPGSGAPRCAESQEQQEQVREHRRERESREHLRERETSAGERGEQSAGPRRGSEASTTWQSEPVDTGFVFLNEHYVEPPYVFRVDGDDAFVNGQLIESSLSEPGESRRGPFPGGMGRYRRRRGFRSAERRLVRRLEQATWGRMIVIVQKDLPVLTLSRTDGGFELLSVLAGLETGPESLAALSSKVPAFEDEKAWQDWLTGFEATPEFRTRVEELLGKIEAQFAADQALLAARKRFETMSWPLSISGMVLVVMAFGHLLSNSPQHDHLYPEGAAQGRSRRAVFWSLGLVVAHSCLDLVWTVLAAQADEMREINPLGSRMISNPPALVAFKLGCTGLAVGLLYAMRKHRTARVASWWACLILTLLTARWLVLDSLLV